MLQKTSASYEWSGPKKSLARLIKIRACKQFKKQCIQKYGENSDWNPTTLSFAGSQAKFERLLVGQGVTSPEAITTIQTYQKLSEKHLGKKIFSKLAKVRNEYLPGMKIWPYSFESFTESYSLDESGCTYPSKSKIALWNKRPYIREMNRIVKSNPQDFYLMDLDLCGIFSEKNATSVVRLMEKNILAEYGVMFVNHQKGRDGRGGKLFSFLRDYFKTCNYVDINSIPNINEENYKYYTARYQLIPLYYICKAYENGYIMRLTKLIEYRDSGVKTIGVNMLQYFFEWVSTPYTTNADNDLREAIENITGNNYEYSFLNRE